MRNAFPLMISTVRVFLTSPTKLRETDASIRKVRLKKSPREFSAKTPKSNQINLFPIHRSNSNNCAPDTLVIDKSTLTRVGDAKPKVVGNHYWRSHNMRYQLQFRFLVSELDYINHPYKYPCNIDKVLLFVRGYQTLQIQLCNVKFHRFS